MELDSCNNLHKSICEEQDTIQPCCSKTQQTFICKSSQPSYSDTNYNQIQLPPSRAGISSLFSSLPTESQSLALSAISNIELPKNFTWRPNGDNNIISTVKNQKECGDCWAVSSTTALSDRFAIKYKIKNPELSYLYTVACIGPDSGIPSKCQCSNGGNLQSAMCGFANKGARLDKCYPSLINLSSMSPQCPTTSCCKTDYSFKIDKESAHLITTAKNPTDIVSISSIPDPQKEIDTWNMVKRDIYNNGPIPTTILEWDTAESKGSLQYFWQTRDNITSIYDPKTSITSGVPSGHALVIVGWGEENGVKYWDIRNSWGNSGPGGGYFKYKMIHNDPSCLVIPRLLNGNTLVGGSWKFIPADLPPGYISEKAFGGPNSGGNGPGGGNGPVTGDKNDLDKVKNFIQTHMILITIILVIIIVIIVI
uniref:Peptidase C1A papain C-terminal domain-containing protein n=1 Tax=viral metagenome TaxID=1070528 RepID=A0A6C0LWX3_9ZZZZ